MSWQSFRLGDLYLIGSSKRVLKSDWQAEGVPFYRGREITQLSINGYVDNELYITEKHYSDLIRKYGAPNEGDIMITAIGTIGNAYIVRKNDRFYFKDASVLWLKRTSDISSQFVNLWLQSLHFFEQLESGNGATVDTLSIQKLQSVKINVPPIQEQQRIVAILDQAFEGIAKARANAEQNLQNARALFESYLQSVFTQRGEGWAEKSLSEICNIKHGFAFDGEDFSSNVALSKPIVITPGNFTEDGKLIFNEKNTKRFSGEPPAAFCFDIGDLVIVMTDLSSKMKILGKPAFIEAKNILHNQRIGRVIFFDDSIEKRFVYYFMMSARFLNNIKVSATGTMVKHTAPSRILSNVISYPSEREKQHEIITKLDELRVETQRLEALYQRKIACLEELKKSLLQQAFAGRL